MLEKGMERVRIKFIRTGTFKMEGEASVDVTSPVDWNEVEELAARREFAEFIPLSMDYDDEDWEFDKA